MFNKIFIIINIKIPNLYGKIKEIYEIKELKYY